MEPTSAIPLDVGLLSLALSLVGSVIGVVVWLVRIEGKAASVQKDMEHQAAAMEVLRTRFSDFREKVAAEYVSVNTLDKMMTELKAELRVVREMVIQLLQAEGLKKSGKDTN